ncbi:MAG: ABC transporter substrate-binding protein [Chloroflexi bacterium]|nr:ABC transporter substrate-binding protein [Chloroflexota bacterium]MDA1228020.1 ABC transporter substrate-binding protein [Chloroflexota bacterium]
MNLRPSSLVFQIMVLAVFAPILLLSCSPESNPPGLQPTASATSVAVTTVAPPEPTRTALATITPATPTASVPTAGPSPAASPTVPVSDSLRGGTLNLASRQAITHYDVQEDVSPALSTWGPGIAYSRLLRFQSGPVVALPSLQVECDLCSRWSMLDDTTIAFELRENAVWQDINPVNRRPVSADDVVFSYLRQQRDESPNAALLNMLESAEAIGPRTLRLSLKAPDADFMVALADGHSKIVAREAVEQTGDLTNGPTVGSGPWVLTESRPGTRHFFSANPDYYEEGYPLLDRLNIHVLQDAATRDAAFQVRNIDVYQMSPPQWQEHLRGVPGAPGLFSPDQGTGLEVALNASSEPFQDARLRRAAMLSMDPWAAVEDIWLGAATVGQGVPSPAADWLLPQDVMRTYFGDVVRARILVTESRGDTSIPVTIKVGDFGEAYLRHAERIADEMRVVGFEPAIEVVNRRYFGEDVWLGGDYQMFAGPMAPVLSPNAYMLTVLHSGGHWNTTAVYDANIDALIESQAQELDPTKRKKIFLEVQRRAMEDSHRFVAAGGVSVWTWWPRVKQFHPNFAGFEYSHWSKVSVR